MLVHSGMKMAQILQNIASDPAVHNLHIGLGLLDRRQIDSDGNEIAHIKKYVVLADVLQLPAGVKGVVIFEERELGDPLRDVLVADLDHVPAMVLTIT